MINKFLKDCKEILGEDYLSKSGEFIYSATNTLRKGDVYLLGFNPGSSPDDKTQRTIKEDLENFESTTINKTLDENWGDEKKNDHQIKLPPLIHYLLDFDLRDICQTNLIFTRSVNAKSLDDFIFHADKYWPCHELILDIIQPRLILSNGSSKTSSAYSYIRDKFGSNNLETRMHIKKVYWKIFSTTILNREIIVAAFPHLSRFHIQNDIEGKKWFKEMIEFRMNSKS